ncbi:MAG: exopolysaccharide transport family protein, partial [Pseudomonadota bacterium]
ARGADTVDPFSLFGSAWQNKWIILGSTMLFVAAAAIILSNITPRYSATAKVLLNPRDTRVVTSQEVVSGLDLSDPVIESEVAFIRSSVLLESVVRDIGLDRMPEFDPRIVEEPGLGTKLNNLFRSVMLFLNGGSADAPSDLTNVEGDSQGTEADTVVPETLADQDATAADNPDNVYRRAVGKLREYLTVSQVGNSYAISISASAQDPQVVALIVNKIAERYISSQEEERVEGTRRAADWLQTRVDDLREQVADAEVTVEQNRADKLIADGGTFDVTSQQVVAMSSQLASARADRAEAQARYDQISNLVATEGFAEAAEVLSSPFVVSLREEHASLARELAGLSSNIGPDHPNRLSLTSMISKVEADLETEVRKIIEGLENEVEVASIRERSIASDVLALEERASSIALSSVEMRHLEREALALRTQYDTMLARLKETRAHVALAREEAKVIEYALPPALPSYPRKKLLISAAAVIGAALGLGLALIRELRSTTYRTTEQIDRELQLPVLAALPREGQRSANFLPRKGRKFFSDEFEERVRRLYISVMARAGSSVRTMCVTSSVTGEGARTTALALAQVAADMKQRVVFVDLNFQERNQPSLNPRRRTPRELVSALRKNGSLSAFIQSNKSTGYDVLPIGNLDAEVSGTFSGTRFTSIIKYLAKEYDLVLIETPPVLESTEAFVIAREADALIYSVSWNRTKAASVRQGLSSLLDLGMVPAGIVLTNVDRARIDDLYQAPQPMAVQAGGVA